MTDDEILKGLLEAGWSIDDPAEEMPFTDEDVLRIREHRQLDMHSDKGPIWCEKCAGCLSVSIKLTEGLFGKRI